MRTDNGRRASAVFLAILAITLTQGALASEADKESIDDLLAAANCGTLANHYGPFDYANPSHVREHLPIVEMHHFNSDVETLKTGMSADIPGPDLDYTLNVFPNHYRALYAMGMLAIRNSNQRVPPGASYSGDCYFHRAISFRPDDPVVRVIFSVYLSKSQRRPEAIKQLETALQFSEKNAEVHYNLGLLYEKSGQDELALKHAKRAYELGYPLPGLRQILERKGIWNNDD